MPYRYCFKSVTCRQIFFFVSLFIMSCHRFSSKDLLLLFIWEQNPLSSHTVLQKSSSYISVVRNIKDPTDAASSKQLITKDVIGNPTPYLWHLLGNPLPKNICINWRFEPVTDSFWATIHTDNFKLLSNFGGETRILKREKSLKFLSFTKTGMRITNNYIT